MKILFEIKTPLKVIIRTTEEYWKYIIEVKHRNIGRKRRYCKKNII
ncbi:MAG: hypothetical protein ACK4JE_03090 [Endomicrobiia bacterium]